MPVSSNWIINTLRIGRLCYAKIAKTLEVANQGPVLRKDA